MKNFSGKVLFLDRADINTDEIIPAKYLTENTKEDLAPFLLEDLKLEGFTPGESTRDAAVIIARENFGCGSSREHAPWALEVNGINLVITENFARIFRQNMFNCGMMALELPSDQLNLIFEKYGNKETTVKVELDKKQLLIEAEGESENIPFEIAEFDKSLVDAGGWVEYADSHY